MGLTRGRNSMNKIIIRNEKVKVFFKLKPLSVLSSTVLFFHLGLVSNAYANPKAVPLSAAVAVSTLTATPPPFIKPPKIWPLTGTDGFVLNSGIINAATGGNVTLLGKHVKNNGMIVAKLGAVNMAAGKAAVVTFDNAGLLGVKITKAVL